jgi:peptidoglycan/LPS O-acetylase OafA/YrhL
MGALDPPTFDHFRLGFRPALDGLRALAITAIIATHCMFVWHPDDAGRYLPGAFVSVDLFFAISGFLITSLLLTETNRKGSVSLGGFYKRRAMRLFPALFVMLIGQLIYTIVTGDALWYDVKGLLLIAFYASNWAIVFHLPQPFGTGQTWSLAVEEQFYAIWPLLLIGITKIKVRRYAMIPFAILILIALTSREYLWHLGTIGWNGIYVQTETRLDVLMFGALLAYLLHTGWKPPSWAPRVGQAALIFLTYCVWKTYLTESWLYHGGFTLIGFSVASVVFLALDNTTRIGRILAWGPITAIGRRSYSLYVWHYLCLLAVARALPAVHPIERLVLALFFTALTAEISHQLVEKPFLARKNKLKLDPLPVLE